MLTRRQRTRTTDDVDWSRSPHRLATPGAESVSLSGIVSALSFALDLTEGAIPGHALRTCLLGMRLGRALGLDELEMAELYYALLLKDIGCSSNSARMCSILAADERVAKAAIKTVDWTDSLMACAYWAWRHTMPGANPWQRLQRLLWMSRYGEVNNVAMFRARCERGAAIVRKIGMGETVAGAIYALDEHWNGAGFPHHLQGEQIPLLSRILAVSQHLDVFAGTQGRRSAIGTLRARSGTWFDPEIVTCAVSLHRDGQLWIGTDSGEDLARVIDMEPGSVRMVGTPEIDGICEAFAEVVDAKSPMTYRHSVGVMEAANAITGELRLPVAQRQLVHRAALLHDIGKLRVPNSILDKRGELTLDEWAIVREHPLLSEHILARVPSFDALARIAGHHHERLDGSGYPYGLTEAELTLEDRIVAAADVYGTLAEERPYRAAMPPREIEAIFRRLVRQRKLDPVCCEALGTVALQTAERSEDEALQLRAGSRFPQQEEPHPVLDQQPGVAPFV